MKSHQFRNRYTPHLHASRLPPTYSPYSCTSISEIGSAMKNFAVYIVNESVEYEKYHGIHHWDLCFGFTVATFSIGLESLRTA